MLGTKIHSSQFKELISIINGYKSSTLSIPTKFISIIQNIRKYHLFLPRLTCALGTFEWRGEIGWCATGCLADMTGGGVRPPA